MDGDGRKVFTWTNVIARKIKTKKRMKSGPENLKILIWRMDLKKNKTVGFHSYRGRVSWADDTLMEGTKTSYISHLSYRKTHSSQLPFRFTTVNHIFRDVDRSEINVLFGFDGRNKECGANFNFTAADWDEWIGNERECTQLHYMTHDHRFHAWR